jgi:hypothetical protein
MERRDLGRGIVVWLATPWEHPDASQVRYVLNIANVVVCGLTAWATWRPNPRVQARLHHVLTRVRCR